VTDEIDEAEELARAAEAVADFQGEVDLLKRLPAEIGHLPKPLREARAVRAVRQAAVEKRRAARHLTELMRTRSVLGMQRDVALGAILEVDETGADFLELAVDLELRGLIRTQGPDPSLGTASTFTVPVALTPRALEVLAADDADPEELRLLGELRAGLPRDHYLWGRFA
jgi:hypothetical protein